MSPIGPQLPPHLTKRKRTPEDESSESPAAKLQATDRKPINENEVDLDSDDDDDYGPSVPQPTVKASIGPTLPPSNEDQVQLDDSDDDDIGPSVPPLPIAPKPAIGPTLPLANQYEIFLDGEPDSSESEAGPAPPPPPAPSATPAPAPAPIKRVHGPAPPPASLSERPPFSPHSSNQIPSAMPAPDSDDDSDDDYGPALPTSTSHTARQAQARLASEAARAAEEAAGPQRDDWMLAPPTASGYRAPDPTKLKNRRFASGPRTNTSSGNGSGGEISSIWTETPEQKRKRLEDAVLGRSGDAQQQKTTSNGSGNGADGPRTKEDLERQERIQSFTETTRGRSLYEEHRESRRGRTLAAEEEEDDPSKRAFDREKDMKLGGRIGTAQRRELLNRAADFGGRFAKGKYL